MPHDGRGNRNPCMTILGLFYRAHYNFYTCGGVHVPNSFRNSLLEGFGSSLSNQKAAKVWTGRIEQASLALFALYPDYTSFRHSVAHILVLRFPTKHQHTAPESDTYT